MHASVDSRLSSRLKWELATGIVFIYLPVRIFLSNSYFSVDLILSKGPLWIVELLVNLIFFRIWIETIEYIEHFFDWLNTQTTIRLPSRLFVFLVGLVLAVLFNIGFTVFWIKMEFGLRKKFNIEIKRTEQDRAPYNRQQKGKANTGLTVLAMLTTVYMVSAARASARLAEVRSKAERLEKEHLQAQFMALKSQLSPHFLFNSFSILASLIEKDPVKSVRYVGELSKSYRYILEKANLELVKLNVELDFIQVYIFLLKSRFENKFHVDIAVSEVAVESYAIAPLTLQMLVENAVKHNVMSVEKPLEVSIKIKNDYLVVSNAVQIRLDSEPSTGLGLTNIINRYALLTDRPVFVNESQDYFTVEIPLLK